MNRIVLLVMAVAAAGCVAGPEAVAPMGPAVEYYREVLVQTIPRGAWVEHNRGYVGVAPIVVRVPASERGLPRGLQIILVKDASGAWEQKVLMPREPVPERMLFDLRGLSGVRSGVSFGP